MSDLAGFLSNRRPPRANAPEGDEAFAERVLRGALSTPLHEPRVWEVAEGLRPRGEESRRWQVVGSGSAPPEWLAAVGDHVETLAARGVLPADMVGGFPLLTAGLRLCTGDMMVPWYGAALLAAWAPNAGAVDAAVGEFLRVAALWGAGRRPWETPPSDLFFTVNGVQWWRDAWAMWLSSRSSIASIFGVRAGCPLFEEVALAALEDLDRAGLPRPTVHQSLASPWVASALDGVDRLVVAPALAWRTLVASGRWAPREVARMLQAGRGRGRRVTWGQAPDPFGPLAEIVAQGLVPVRASAYSPNVTLGLPLA